MNDLSFPELIKNQIIQDLQCSNSIAEVLSLGELTSSRILSYYFETQGFNHTLLNATKIIKTNSQGVNSSVNWDETIRNNSVKNTNVW